MSAEEGMVASYQLQILVDHSQFFLADCDWETGPGDVEAMYDADAFARHLGVAPGILSIFTARWYATVDVELVQRTNAPDDDFTGWDNVAEASLDVQTGCLAMFGPESEATAERFAVPPGTYRVRVYAGGIKTVDDEMSRDGGDHYRAVLWPEPFGAPNLLHVDTSARW